MIAAVPYFFNVRRAGAAVGVRSSKFNPKRPSAVFIQPYLPETIITTMNLTLIKTQEAPARYMHKHKLLILTIYTPLSLVLKASLIVRHLPHE